MEAATLNVIASEDLWGFYFKFYFSVEDSCLWGNFWGGEPGDVIGFLKNSVEKIYKDEFLKKEKLSTLKKKIIFIKLL